MINEILFFMLGLVGLLFGAELITRSSLLISRKFGLSEGFIGLVVLSLGTTLPEIMVTIAGALEKRMGVESSGIVIGNVIGSSMTNMALIFGLSGLLGGVIHITRKEAWSYGFSLVAATSLFVFTAQDGAITQKEAWLLVAGYFGYVFLAKKVNSQHNQTKPFKKNQVKKLGKLLFQLIGGLALIAQSSQWVIEAAITLAIELGVSQVVIGAILIGIGTSLPELVIALTALVKGSRDLSVGNLLGSSIVNMLLALGVGGLIAGWTIERRVATFDLPFLLFCVVIITLFMLSRKRLERREAILMLSLFVVYVSLKLMGW